MREERAPRPRRCATSRRRGTCPPDANSVPGWFGPVGEASGGQSGRPDCPPGSRPPEMLGSCPGGCGWRGSCSCCASWRAAPGRRPERSPSSAEDVARDSGPRRRTRVAGSVKFPRPDPSSARIRGRPSVRHPGRPSWWHTRLDRCPFRLERLAASVCDRRGYPAGRRTTCHTCRNMKRQVGPDQDPAGFQSMLAHALPHRCTAGLAHRRRRQPREDHGHGGHRPRIRLCLVSNRSARRRSQNENPHRPL